MPTLPSPASPPPALVEPDEEDLHTVPFPQPCPLWLSDTPPPLLGTLPPEDNILSTSPPELETRAGRENFVASLPAAVKGPLNKPYGKPHRNMLPPRYPPFGHQWFHGPQLYHEVDYTVAARLALQEPSS